MYCCHVVVVLTVYHRVYNLYWGWGNWQDLIEIVVKLFVLVADSVSITVTWDGRWCPLHVIHLPLIPSRIWSFFVCQWCLCQYIFFFFVLVSLRVLYLYMRLFWLFVWGRKNVSLVSLCAYCLTDSYTVTAVLTLADLVFIVFVAGTHTSLEIDLRFAVPRYSIVPPSFTRHT